MSSYGFVAPARWSTFHAIIARAHAGSLSALDAIRETVPVDVDDAPGCSRGFYTELERARGIRVGVAGYKSGIHALEALYELRWIQPESRCDCVPRADVKAPMLLGLVERLLLGRRRYPGIPSVERAPSWPAHDAPLLLGALDVVETRMLAQRLRVWEERAAAAGPGVSGPMSTRLFERIRAAATAGHGLVAMHAML